MAQVESQHYPDHHHTHHPQASSSSSPPGVGSPSSTSSSLSTNKPLIHVGHYKMLMDDTTNSWSDEDLDLPNLVWEPDNSTMLHLAASIGQVDHISSIVNRCPDLLTRPNSQGDLPVHAATRSGQLPAVKRLVELGDVSVLKTENTAEKNTALHIALENQQKEIAAYLFKDCPETCRCFNSQGISPLYLAIKAEFWNLVESMLSGLDAAQKTYDERSYVEPHQRKPVAHAAIVARRKDILEKILTHNADLIYSLDEKGRTPMSYAAYIGFHEGINYLLTATETRPQGNVVVPKFQNYAFQVDEDGSFPIHSACSGGSIQVLNEFSCLPMKTSLLPNKKGQNVLHVAAASGRVDVVRLLLRKPEFETMINMKDCDGNTPLHLAAIGKHPKVVYVLTWDDRVKLSVQNKYGFTALDIAEDYVDIPSFDERLTWLALIYAGVPRAPQLHYFNMEFINQEDLTNIPNEAYNNHLISTILKKKKKKNKYKERLNTLLTVSILVVTVTFASGFTVPGGYNNSKPDEGMATLVHKWAFQVFVISDTIALYSSILAAVTLIWAHLDDLRLILLSLDFALPLLGIALAMMSVAFMAGVYVVLHDLVWLGILILVIGGACLTALLFFFIPLYSPTFCVRNKILRLVFHAPFIVMLWACDKGKRAMQCS